MSVLLSLPRCLTHPPALERRMRLGGTRNVHWAAPAQPTPFPLGSACPAELSELFIPAPNPQSLWVHSQTTQRERRNLSHEGENHTQPAGEVLAQQSPAGSLPSTECATGSGAAPQTMQGEHPLIGLALHKVLFLELAHGARLAAL